MTDLLKSIIRDIPDFPKKGIVFKDITPLLMNPEALHLAVVRLGEAADLWKPDKILGIESRGFIFGAALAMHRRLGFLPARKKGKLPYEVVRAEYQLEYGTDALEMHADAVKPGERIMIVDDLLATGGTAEAIVRLIRQMGGNPVGAAFVIELGFLSGRKRLDPLPVHSLLNY